jgi:ankyrin repeat protein
MDAQERLNKKQASSSAAKEPLAIPRRHGGGSRSLFTGRTLKQNPKINLEDHSVVDTSPEAETFRRAAAKGENDALHQYLSKNPNFIHAADSNHWLALHEAIRAGHAETVKYLVESGADLGAKVKNGGAALWLAKEVLPVDHEIIEYLISEGAPNDA